AGVDDLLGRERLHAHGRVVLAQQPGAVADMPGAEARAGPVADPAVERHAEHGDVSAGDLVQARQPGERRRAAVARDLGGFGRADRSDRVLGHDTSMWTGALSAREVPAAPRHRPASTIRPGRRAGACTTARPRLWCTRLRPDPGQ